MEINGDCYKECISYFSPLLVLRSYQNFIVLPLASFENENSFEKQCKHCYLSVPLCQIFLEEKLSKSCSKSNMLFVGKEQTQTFVISAAASFGQNAQVH